MTRTCPDCGQPQHFKSCVVCDQRGSIDHKRDHAYRHPEASELTTSVEELMTLGFGLACACILLLGLRGR